MFRYNISCLLLLVSEIKFVFGCGALIFDQEIESLSPLWALRWIFGRNNFFWMVLRRKRERANRRGRVLSGRWSCGGTSISICSYWNWKLKGCERASRVLSLEEICMRCQIFDLASGGARWSNTAERKRRVSIFRRPNADHQHKYIIFLPREAILRRVYSGPGRIRSRSICSRRRASERLCFLIWSSFKPLPCKNNRREREVKFSLARSLARLPGPDVFTTSELVTRLTEWI
jgi:hypothetical protein